MSLERPIVLAIGARAGRQALEDLEECLPGSFLSNRVARKQLFAGTRGRPSRVVRGRRLPSELKMVAAILKQPVIPKILTHLGLQTREPPRRGARG